MNARDNPLCHAALREVDDLHRFFEDWFNARLPNTDQAYARFPQVLAADFRQVAPDGQLRSKETLEIAVRGLWGCGKDSASPYRIWIENSSARPLDATTCLVLYQEWQQAADTPTVRQSSAVFGRNPALPNGVEWLHLHETWITRGE